MITTLKILTTHATKSSWTPSLFCLTVCREAAAAHALQAPAPCPPPPWIINWAAVRALTRKKVNY